jgi:RND family efflux transporter MFP subunit
MKRRALTWTALALLVAGGGFGGWRYLGARQAAAAATAAAAAAAPVEASMELAAADLVTAATVELPQGLPLTGSLRAVQSAVVKARVAGELQGLAVREGDPVQQGQEIARIDPTEAQARLAQAREQADAARTQVEIAQRHFDNNKALVDQGFISRTALEASQSSLTGAQATHKAALAAVDVARKTLDDTVLRAPIAGMVSQRLAQPGERLAIDARVVEIVDPRRLELEASVSAADSVRVRIGQTASLSVEGLPQSVRASVARINPTAQAGTRSVPVYLSVEAAPGMRQGLFAQGLVQTGRVRAVAVPLGAIRTDKPAPYLQIVEGGRIVHRTVTPGARGARDGLDVAAVDGVAEGAQVLLGHVGPLREGTPVRLSALTSPASARPAN